MLNKLTYLFFSALLTFSTACANQVNYKPESETALVSSQSLKTTLKGTTTGIIKYHNIKTQYLKSGNRNIVVYLPPSYNDNSSKNYPVLYMHDGQNIFDQATGAFGKEWYVDEKVQYLIQKNVIQDIIVVGVYNGEGERINELTWTYNPEEKAGGDGKKYGDFLTKDVKPFIDKNYRTKSDRLNTAVAGSSLGGLISIYLASNYPETFSKIGIMSPSIWWNNGEVLKEVPKMKGAFDFWVDCGSQEGSDPNVMINYVNQLSNLLTTKFGNDHVFKFIQPNAGHNEEAWATRIHAPIIEFFGKDTNVNNKTQLIKKLMVLEEWSKL